jgi:hypothetical protein
VRSSRRGHRDQAHLVTEARPGLSADIAYRERRYLIMMGIRTACFVIAVLFFVNHLGWLTAIPAVGALVIPYFAVIFANSAREPGSRRGFRQYKPNLPERYMPPEDELGHGRPGSGASGNASPPSPAH